MKRILSLLTLFCLMLIVSCFNPPEYSNTPSIKFERVRTKAGSGLGSPDSLLISISFKDGDGDLGVADSENSPPFNLKWYFLLAPGPTCENTVTPPCKKISYINPNDLSNVVKWSTRRTNPDYDTLPVFVGPYGCGNYQILKGENNTNIDTVYYQDNKRYYNIFCDLYTKEPGPTGPVFKKYTVPANGGCPLPFYGRFAILGKDGDPDLGLPTEGILTYRFSSSSLYSTLKTKTLKVKIRIVDRKGNYSNEVESNEFQLN